RWNNSRFSGVTSHIQHVKRPVLQIGDGTHLKDALKKRWKKGSVQRLEKEDRLVFERLQTLNEFDRFVDQIIEQYDTRQAYAHGLRPFSSDPRKRLFYRSLMQHQEIFHATVFRLGDEVLSSHLGLHDGRTVYLSVFGHSFSRESYSPGTLHILQLG